MERAGQSLADTTLVADPDIDLTDRGATTLAAPIGPMILVVDDDPLLGKVVEACLDFEGADVRTAHTLGAAREELRHLNTSIAHVILDRTLPDGDGLELLDELARHCPDAAIVVFSASDDLRGPEDLKRISKADVSGLVDHLGLEEIGPRPALDA